MMITALDNGARQVIPCLTKEEVFEKSGKLSKNSFLLCGERDAQKIKGFDLGNSPLEFTSGAVKDKTIFLTTTNGTKALRSCSGANHVLIGSFLNINAIAGRIINTKKLVLVCSGTNGRFSLDDGMCAAAIIDSLSKQTEVVTDDLGEVLLKAWQNGQGNLHHMLKNCFHLNYLIENGYVKDVEYSLRLNKHPVVPEFRDNFSVIIP